MIYQKLLMGNKPYFVSTGKFGSYEVHRHPEIEISYCLEGGYDIICENKRYSLSAGDFIIIPPTAAHEIPQNNQPVRKGLTIELGYIFLGEYFEIFAKQQVCCFKKSELTDSKLYSELAAVIEQTAELRHSDSEFDELIIKSNLYRISALLLQLLSGPKSVSTPSRKLTDVKKIDKALDIIYNKYYEPLSVEDVSMLCGYSKSNFCKIFKNITGYTFHNTLNSHRVEIACMLLRESNYTVERIASETGFADIKSFCRVFKKHTGKNAGEYRKSIRAE